MKKTIGYGYKKSTEKLDEVLAEYHAHWGLFKTREEADKWRKKDIEGGLFGKTAKVKIFKVVAIIED